MVHGLGFRPDTYRSIRGSKYLGHPPMRRRKFVPVIRVIRKCNPMSS